MNLENVSAARGTALLLDGVSFGVAEADRVGVVGRNGAGKTTLVDVLAKALPADADVSCTGRVSHAGGLRVGMLRQDVRLDPELTVRDAVLGARAEHEWAGDARVREVLAGLGLLLPATPAPALALDTTLHTLSGGEVRRVALAALLVGEHDLLVLDEPTNHLDVQGVDWLAHHLLTRSSALVVVTHDRWFLDTVCTDTWEVEAGRVETYQGGYSAYVLARAERARLAAATEARRTNLLRKELAWLRRGPPARTAKPRFRIEAANALIADEPPPRDTLALCSLAMARLGKSVYDVEDVTVRFGDRLLFDRLTWRLGPGDRIGLVGANGSGKTTLLRLLAGAQQADTGVVRVGATVRTAYLSQEVGELEPRLRVIEAVEEVARVVDLGRGRTLTAGQLLERFGFFGGAAQTRVGDLSGGERRRLQLMRLLMGEPNVLLLDEPTNDLDIDTLNALEDLLDGFAGTLVVASHDRYFLERTVDRTVALRGDGGLAELPGGVEQYLSERPGAEPIAGPARARRTDPRGVSKELGRLERALAKLERREGEIHAAMAAQASDYLAVAALDAQLRAVREEKAATEDSWLRLAGRD